MYTNYDDFGAGLLGASIAIIIIALIVLVIGIAAFVVICIGKWKLFKKAGKNGWEAIIPFYSGYTLVEIAGLNWYWTIAFYGTTVMSIITSVLSFLGFLSIVGTIATVGAEVAIALNMQARLHKEGNTGWLVCAILFNPIMMAISGFSKTDTYDGSVVVNPDSFVASMINKQPTQGVQTQQSMQPQAPVTPVQEATAADNGYVGTATDNSIQTDVQDTQNNQTSVDSTNM